MVEFVLLLVLLIGVLAMFTLAGLGLVVWLIPRGTPGRLLLAPILGASVLTAALASAVTVMTSRTAAWVVVLPILVASSAAVFVAWRRGRFARTDVGGIGWMGLGSLPVLMFALFPFLVRRSGGPINFGIADGWFWYAPMAKLLQRYPVDTPIPANEPDPTLAIQSILADGMRVGHDAVHGAFATFVGAPVDLTLMPFVLALTVVVPVTVFAICRVLGLGGPAAALGAGVAGGTPTLGAFLATSGPGLFALAAVPTFLWLLARGIKDRSWPLTCLAAIPLAGILGTYPESLPVTVGAGALLVLVWMIRGERGAGRRQAHVLPLLRGLATGVLAIAVTPAAFGRTLTYVETVRGVTEVADTNEWGVTLGNVDQWVTGMVHLFELRNPAAFSVGESRALTVLALLLIGVAVLGVLRPPREWGTPVIAGVVVSAAFAFFVDRSSDCSYCFFRGAVFVVPFLGIAFAAGAGWLLRLVAGRGLWMRAGTLLALVALVGVPLRAQAGLTDATRKGLNVTSIDDRRVTDVIREQGASGVLVEGSESASNNGSAFHLSAALSMVAKAGARPSYDPFLSRFVAGSGFGEGSLRPDYELVATRYAGVESDRVRVADAGRLTVLRRAPIDVSIATKDRRAVSNEDAAATAIPWILSPFQVNVVGTSPVPVAVRLGFVGPDAGTVRYRFTVAGRDLETVRTVRSGRVEVCAVIALTSPTTRIDVTPAGLTKTRNRFVQQDQPQPRVPELLGVSLARIDPAGCAGSGRAPGPG